MPCTDLEIRTVMNAAHVDVAGVHHGDEGEHPILEDDSEPEEKTFVMKTTRSSTLSILNDLLWVYALHSFAATVKNVEGDTLFLMTIASSFAFSKLGRSGTSWLKICIETPSERLPCSNKHRNNAVRFFITHLCLLHK